MASFLLLAVVAGMGSGRDEHAQPGFLTAALGAPQSAAPLVREPLRGTRVAIRERGYEVARTDARVGLELAGVAGEWDRFTKGAARPTAFGAEAIVVDRKRAEQFLTIRERQGRRTWRWRLGTDLHPQVTPEGWVSFAAETGRLADVAIEPVAIFDSERKDVTPEGLAWTISKRAGSWWLELHLDDRGLPVPYVIDPSITLPPNSATATGIGSASVTIPAAAAEGDLMVVNVLAVGGTGTTINTPTGFNAIFAQNNAGTWIAQQVFRKRVVAGEPNTSVSFTWTAGVAGSVEMLVYRGAASGGNPVHQSAGYTSTLNNSWDTFIPAITTTASNTVIVGFASVDSNPTTFPAVAGWNARGTAGGPPKTGGYDRACATTCTVAQTTVTTSGGGNGQRSKGQLGNAVALLTDTTATANSLSVNETAQAGKQHFDSAANRFYYSQPAAGQDLTFTITNAATDADSGVASSTFPTVTHTGFNGTGVTDSTPTFGSNAYTITSANATAPAAPSVTSVDRAANTATSTTFSIVRDVTAPAGGALTVNGGGAYDTDGSFPIDSRTDYAETMSATASGLASSTLVRETATLTNDACGTFGSPTTIVGSPAQSGLATGCYRYTLTGTDNVGNATSVSATVKVDTSAPTVTATAPSEGTNPGAQHYNATDDVFFFRSGAAGDFALTATATDGDTGVGGVTFPDLSGVSDFGGAGGTDNSSPYASTTYTFGTSAADPGSRNVSTQNGAGTGATDAIVIRADSTAPAGGAVTVNGGGAYDADGAFAIDTRTDYTESASATASGLASSTLVRESATLANDACGSFGSPTTIVGSPAQSGLADGCYRYTLTGTDNVGNTASVTTVVKVDSTAPASAADALTVYETAAGFTVTYTASDGGSGVKEIELWVDGPGAGSYALDSTDTTPASASFAFTAAEGDGLYRFYTRAKDNADNHEDAPGSPDASTTLESGAPNSAADALGAYVGASPITVGYSASDPGSGVQEVELWADGPGAGGYALAATDTTPASPSFSFTASEGDGLYRFYTRGRDNVGNYEAAPASPPDASTTLDTVKPASAADALAAFVGASPITVGYSATDAAAGVLEVELWVDGPGAGGYALAATDATPASPSFSYTAAEGDGLYRFYTRARDNAGNVEDAPGSPDASTTLDTTKPTSSASALPAFQTSAGFTVAYAASDGGSGVDEVELWVDGPGAGSYALEATDTTPASPSFSFTASEGDGLYRFYTRARDDAGNGEDAPGSPDTSTTLDASPASAPTLSFGSFTNASATGSTVYVREGAAGGFTVTADSDDPESGIDHHTFAGFWGEGGNAAGDPAATAYTFAGADTAPGGAQPVTATNGAGASSGSSTFTVVADTTAPVTSILCGGGSCAGWSTSSPVTVTLSATDGGSGVDEIKYTTDGSDPSPVNGTVYAGGFAVAATTTVRFRAYDEVGNEELVGSQLVRVDTTAPSAPALSLSESEPDEHAVGTTLYYNPSGANTGSFTVDATAGDAQSGVDKIAFPAVAGMSGGGDDSSSPYQGAYGWTTTTSASGAQTVTVHNGAGLTANGSFTVTPDTTAPTSSILCGGAACPAGWVTSSPVSVSLSASDGGSGVDQIKYTTDGSDPLSGGTVYSGAFAVAATATVKYAAVDNVGNAETVSSQLIRIDETAPTAPTLAFSSLTNTSAAGSTVYFRTGAAGGFTVTPTSIDAESGVASYAYPALGGGWSNTGGDYTFTGAAADPAEPNDVTATNNAGLTSSASSFTVTADGTAPTSSIACDGGACPGGWVSGSTDVSFSGSDAGSGLDLIMYTTDGSDPLAGGSVYSAPFTVSSTTTVKWAALDRVGNAQAVQTQLLQVDNTKPTAPSLAFSAPTNASWDGSTLWFRSGAAGGFTVTGTSSDPQSGVASYAYPALGSGWSNTNGAYTFTAAAADPAEPNDVTATNNAGLVSDPTAFPVTADGAAPSGMSATVAGGFQNTLSVSVTVDNGSDAGSGVDATTAVLEREEASLDNGDGSCDAFGGSWTTVSSPDTTVADGKCYRYRLRISDKVGNEGTSVVSAVVKVDTSLPAATMNDPGANLSGTVSLTSVTSDGGSGVATVVYERSPANAGTWTATPASWNTTLVTDGLYDLRVVATDAAGNVRTSALVEDRRVDNADPETTIDSQPADPDNDATPTFTFSSPETGSTFECRVGGGSWSSCSSPHTTSTLADGNRTFEVRATDPSGNDDQTPASHSWLLDTVAPADGSITVAAGYDTDGSVAIATDNGTDSGSGVNAGSAVVERESATLAADSCQAFSGSFTGVPVPDTSVASGNCYRYRLRVRDNAGNWATSNSASEVKVDLTAPAAPGLVLADVSGSVVAGGTVWFRPGTTGSFTVTPTTTDAESGIASYSHPNLGTGWSRVGTTWSFTSAAVDPNEPNNVTALNGAGLVSPATSFTVSADSAGPTTTASCDGAACSAGWYTSSPVSVTLNASDAGAGVKEIRYTTDGSDPTVTSPLYAGAISVTPGTTTIKFRGEDQLGNLEPVGTLVVRIDVTAPTTPALTVSGFANASESGGIVYFRPGAAGGFTVAASSSDPESGVASTSFPALGAGWSESAGAYSFSSSAADPAEPFDVTTTNGAGLPSAGAGLTVTADSVAPATTVACTGGCAPWHTSAPVTVTLSATDALSGVDEIRYSTDGSAPTTLYTGPFQIAAEGSTTVRFAARDEVGNVEVTQSQLVKVDTVAPAASMTDPGVYARGDVTLDSTQSDASSGVATVQFRYRPTSGAWTNTPATWDTDALANGDYELHVVVTDVAGNATTSSPVSVMVDNLAPSITLDPPSSPASGTVTLSSSATDAHSGVDTVEYEFLHPVDGWTATTSAWDTAQEPDGVYDLRARATDNAGNVSGWSVVSGIQVDNNAPTVALTSPAEGAFFNAAAADPAGLTATADDAGGTGVQRVDFFEWSGGAWSLVDTDTTSPYGAAWPLPADGSRRVMARATDNAGHSSESEVTVTVDRTAPTAGITDPGAYLRLSPPLVGSASDATSGVNSVAFQRSPAGADTWTTIATDTTAPYSTTFDTTTGATPDGLYDLRVFVTDVAGNTASAAVASRRIDNTAPTGTLTDPGQYLRGLLALSGSAADGGSGVASVAFRRSPEGMADWTTIATDTDGGDGWSATLDTNAGGTPDGLYDFELVVTDRAGNTHAHGVGSRAIDNTKPTASIDDPGANRRGTIALGGTATDATSGVATVDFERRPSGGGGWDLVGTDADGSNGWSASFDSTAGATPDGLYDFRITATDRAGNSETSVVANRRIDNTAPAATLNALPAYLRSTVAFGATATDAGSGVERVEFERSPAGSGGPWTTVGTEDTNGGDGWSTTWASGPDGTFDFRVRATDVAGNTDVSPLQTRMIDNTAPETSNDAPASSANPVTVTLSVTDSGSGPSATQHRVLPGGSWTGGSSVTLSAPADHSRDGIWTIEYYSTDAAGNVEATESVEVLIDTTGPSGTVDDPANYLRALVTLSADPTTPADVSSVRFEFAPAGSGAWAPIGADVLAAPYEITWDTTSVTDGAYDLQVTMFDALGNPSVTSLPGKTVDNAAPSVAITAPASGAVKSGNVAITATAGDATAGIEHVTFRAKPSGAAGFSDIGVDASPGPGGTYAISWPTAGLPDGLADIQVVARDWAGNEMGDTLTVILDNNAPTVTVSAPGAAVSGDVTLTATASGDVLEVEFRVDGSPIGTDNDGSNGWSVTWSTSGDGSRSITARATDVGGNEGTSPAVNVQLDNTDPTGAVTTPPDGATVGGPSVPLGSSAADSGSGVATVVYQYKGSADPSFVDIAGATWDTTPQPTGPYQLRARITDNAGNSFTTAAITVQVDSSAPTVVLTNPGASLSGTVTLNATVSGVDAQRVVFERSPAGAGSWTEIGADTAAPWSADFDTRSAADGVYDLRATVQDSFGNTNSSVRSNIRIDNTAPRVLSSTPADGTTVAAAGSLDVAASETLAAVNNAKLDGAAIAISPSGTSFSVAGPFADGPHTLSGELEDVAGKTASFSLHFTVLAGSPAVMPYVEMNSSAGASTSLTSPDGTARVIVPAGAWSSASDWLVIRIQPLNGTGGAVSVVDVTARWALAGTQVHSFSAPIEIVLLNTSAHGVVPATLEGSSWRMLRPVPAAGSLPGDWQDGFWRAADGVHIVTRHLSVFGLIADVVPPSAPRAVGVVDAEGLKLRWVHGSDDSGQLGQVKLYVNGVPYANYDLGQTEAKLGAWSAADTRSFTFTQLDLAGNESVHSKPLRGVPAVVGLELAAAGRALGDRGFSVGKVTQRPSSAAPGTVLEPAGLALAEEGGAIDLVVAEGASVPAPQARLVFSVVGTRQLDPRTRSFVAARIKVSRASRVTATLISPKGRRLYTWRLQVKAGATINRLPLPRQLRRPGAYRIVFTAVAGNQTIRRTIRVRLVGKLGKTVRPAGAAPVDVVLAGDSRIRKDIALGLDGTRTRLVQTTTEGAYSATGNARRNVRVVVVDIDLFGVGLVRDLHTVFPSVKLLALASTPRDLARAMKAGAAVALPRSSSPSQIARMIRRLSAAR